MTSTRLDRGIARAMTVEDRGSPYLVVERLERTRGRGPRRGRRGRGGLQIVDQRMIKQAMVGGQIVDLWPNARDIELAEWRGSRLRFRVDLGGETLRCGLNVDGNNAFVARCRSHQTSDPHPGPDWPDDDDDDGHPHHPHPQLPNWAGDPRVIQACGDAFTGADKESACLDEAARARVDPTSIIGACERAMEGDDNELACVAAAVDAGYDMTSNIDACERAMEGDANELACVRAVVPARGDISRIIDQCEQSMNGDDAELACIQRAALPR